MSDEFVQVGQSAVEASSAPAQSASVSSAQESQTIAPSSLDGDPVHSGSHEEWYWAEGVKGEGPKPEFFKDGTFKYVSDQAINAIDMKSKFDKRYAGFTGAPEGDYEINLNESLAESEYNIDTDSDSYKAFSEMARNLNMSQEGFDEALNIFGQYEQNMMSQTNEQMNDVIQQHNDAEIAKMAPDVKKQFSECVKMAANIEGMSQEGLNDILNGITSAKGVEDFNRLIMASVDTAIPTSQDFNANNIGEDDVFTAHQKWHGARAQHGDHSAEAMQAEAEMKQLYKRVYGE